MNVRFSNGETIEDIPFYDGYYVKTDEPIVVAYPGYPHVAIAFASGGSMWDRLGIAEGDSAEISIRQRNKYRTIQENFSAVYSDNRNDYRDDTTFANFRSLSGGNIRPDTFFRGASPINNEHKRAGTVDKLIRAEGIQFDMNLSDSAEEVQSFIKIDSGAETYLFTELLKKGQAELLNLTAAYRSKEFAATLVNGLKEMMKAEGPYYIHCIEGKDRTGFVCLLLESLCGADYDELKNDYMLTYENYYGISKEKTPERYDAFVKLKLNDILEFFADTEDEATLLTADYYHCARRYLESGGMSSEEIDALERFLIVG